MKTVQNNWTQVHNKRSSWELPTYQRTSSVYWACATRLLCQHKSVNTNIYYENNFKTFLNFKLKTVGTDNVKIKLTTSSCSNSCSRGGGRGSRRRRGRWYTHILPIVSLLHHYGNQGAHFDVTCILWNLCRE